MSEPGVPSGRPLRVLLVEDSENDATLLVRELRRGGYHPLYERVYTPEEMERALKGARERGEAFEVVISDYHMPRFRAPDALALLRRLGYDVPFIVVSGKIGEDAAVGIMKAGADDYLTKENMSRLCPAIERELGEAKVRKERERAERALARSEERFRRLVEQIPAVTYVQEPAESDNPKAITYTSPQYEAMLGYPPETEMLDEEHWLRVVHPADRERVMAEEARTDQTGEPYRMEYRQIARDGSVVWVRDQATLVRDGAGRPLYWLGVQYDITEQKRIESELRQGEQRYRTFIQQSTEGIWRFELEEPLATDAGQEEQIEHVYRHTYLAECNDAMARMYGYERAEELVGARLVDLLPPSEPENVEYLRAFMRSGYRLTDAESVELDRYGKPRVFLNNLTGIVEEGFVVRAWGTRRDITEQKGAEEELARLASFPRLNPNPIVETSSSGEPTYLNPAAEREFADLPELGTRHPALADLESVEREILGSGGRPFYREVRVGDKYYQQVVSRLPESGLLRLYAVDVTERKAVEEALRISEKRFRTIIEQSPLSTQIFSPDGLTLQVNRAWEELWGVTLEDIAGYNILEDPQLVEKGMMPYIERGFAGERTLIPPVLYDPEETIPDLTSNAEPGRWVRAFIYPVEDEAGSIREVILMHEDITERRRAEEALKQSEERFRATFEQAAVGMAQVGLDGRWSRVNQKLCEIVGYTAQEMRSLTFQDITHPDDLESDLEHVRRLLAGEIETYSMEKRYFRKDGSIVWIDLTVSLLRAASGEARYFIGVIEDISERKRTEAALNQSEELYRTVVEQAAENIYLVDAETMRVLESNAALQTSLGYTAEELKRMTLYEIVAHDRGSIDQNVERVMEEGRSFLGERQYRRRDDSLADVEVNVSAVPYDGRRVMCIVAHDVTEHKRAERALEEIREAERNRIARELHDGTLQDIVYALQEIQIVQAVSGNGGNPALEDSAEALRRSVEGLRGAIFELRLEETLGRSFVSSLENLVDLNRRMARGRYELELVVEDEFPSGVSGRTGQELTRIVQEALTNVRRHAEARHVRVRLGVEGGLAFAEISDDGRGFATGNPKIGVGRHSMHQRALEMGGELEVESDPGEGTRVRLRVPISRLVKG